MIEFKSIKWKNFLSTGNSYNEIHFGKHKTTLITGDNGAGKSTLLDALSYVLYGKSFRGINIGNLINSVNSKDSVVEVEFNSGKNEYKIIRGQKPKIFEIHKNGEVLDQEAKSKDQQSILEDQILRMSHKAFCQVVILGSSNYIPFMKLPARDRRIIVENLLDIDIFSMMSDLVKSKYSENKEQIAVTDSKIESTKNSLEKIEFLIESLKEKKEQGESWHLNEIAESENKIRLMTDYITESEKKIEAIKSEISKGNYHSDLEKAKVCRSKIEDSLDRCLDNIERYKNNDKCLDCGQTIEEEVRSKKISDLEFRSSELSDALSSINKKIKQIKVKIDRNDSLSAEMNEIEGSIISKRSSISGCEDYIGKMKKSMERDRSSEGEIEEKMGFVSSISKDLEDREKERVALVKHRKDLEVVQSLIKDGGIKARIIKHYLPTMNDLINRFLKEMDFFCEFSLNEDFEEKIKSRYRDDFSYFNFSEGERLRIDVSILLAWREIARMKNSVSCNLLILDEIFDSSLDSVGMEDFMKILREMKAESNIFVISHKSGSMNDRFDNHIEFKKKGIFSEIQKKPKKKVR